LLKNQRTRKQIDVDDAKSKSFSGDQGLATSIWGTPYGGGTRVARHSVSSEDDIEQERPVLSSIAEELGFTFVAVILRVEDPDRTARAAQDAGSAINRVREPDPITVVTDPFGGYWALIKREHAGREARSLNEVPRKTA